MTCAFGVFIVLVWGLTCADEAYENWRLSPAILLETLATAWTTNYLLCISALLSLQRDNPDKVVPVGEMGRLAGVRWTLMSAAEREPYERLSSASKALYARLKTLTPEQRAAREAEDGYTQLLVRTESCTGLLCMRTVHVLTRRMTTCLANVTLFAMLLSWG